MSIINFHKSELFDLFSYVVESYLPLLGTQLLLLIMMIIEQLLHARHYAKSPTCIIFFESYTDTIKSILLLLSLFFSSVGKLELVTYLLQFGSTIPLDLTLESPLFTMPYSLCAK